MIPAPSLHYKLKKNPLVILTDLPDDFGTDYKGKPMVFDAQCWNFVLRVSLTFIPMLIYVNLSEKWILCYEGTPGMLLLTALFGECNLGMC